MARPVGPMQFLGSKIQLISKSDIRYEGILYTIDTEQSSVALANGIVYFFVSSF
jgi:hypothetical protein